MKTLLRIGGWVAVVLVGLAGWSRAAVNAGDVAPDFSATDIAGREQRLAGHRGKIVVLEWTNPECPFVRKHYESGNMPRLQREATEAGVVWLAINSGRAGAQGDLDDAEARTWLREKQAAPTAYVRDRDGRIGRLYGAKATPQMVVIAADGTVAYAGAIDSIRSADPADIAKATNYVRAAIESLQAGRQPEKASTPPYGCRVHY